LLSIGAVAAGMVFHHAFIDVEEGAHFWQGSVAFDTHLMHAIHEVPLWVKLSPAIAMLAGLTIAWQAYIRDPSIPGRFTGQFRLLHAFLYNKWYFDEIYDVLLVRPSIWLGRVLWKRGDEGTIDRFGPDGAAAAVFAGTRLTARLQTGYLYTYALVMLLGVAAATTWAMAQ
jgi:NADH-quinone oxidoreductase subunit L